ncbi:hypothetical protein BaRGS_00014449, partial [Batillaria attramentaria]
MYRGPPTNNRNCQIASVSGCPVRGLAMMAYVTYKGGEIGPSLCPEPIPVKVRGDKLQPGYGCGLVLVSGHPSVS